MFLIPTLVISSCASFDESGASPQPDESTCDADLWVDRSPLRRLSGGQHALTGAPHLVGDEDVSSLPWKGMSVDQVIADRVMVPGRFRSLHIKNRGRVASNSSDDDNFCRYAGAAVPIESDLERLWERLFPSTESESTLEGELIAGRSTVLDSLDTHYGDSLDRVAPADELKLETHRERLAELKLRVESMANLDCTIPDEALLDSVDSDEAAYHEVNHVLATMLAAAFSCDLTRVVHLHISTGNGDGASCTSRTWAEPTATRRVAPTVAWAAP